LIQTDTQGRQRVSNRQQSTPNFVSREGVETRQNSDTLYNHRPSSYVQNMHSHCSQKLVMLNEEGRILPHKTQ
jgi:hypothetical protein